MMEPGQVRQIGEHRLSCGDVQGPQVEELIGDRRVWTLYSDPPWGDGNLSYWTTMNRKMTGRDFAPMKYETLIARLGSLVERFVDGHVFIETGPRWEAMLMEAFHGWGLSGVTSYQLRYNGAPGGLPNPVVYGHKAGVEPFRGDPTGMLDQRAVDHSLAGVSHAGAYVLDPCCGMGNTARGARRNGMLFLGNEFNSARLAKTEAYLEGSRK